MAAPRTWTILAALACTGAAMLPTGTRADLTSDAKADPAPVGQGFVVTPSDLAFILKQIKIAERHSRALIPELDPGNAIPNNPNPAGDPFYCQSMVGGGVDQISSPLVSFGLRTVTGECNNLLPNQSDFGAADHPFPRLATPSFRQAEASPNDFFGPGSGTIPSSTYASKKGFVFDTQPRVISNLIVDQTPNNPAAVAAAGYPVRSQGNPGVFSCAGISDIQLLSGSPDADFVLHVGTVATGTIPQAASPADIQTALEGVAGVGAGNVTVVGNAGELLSISFSPDLGDVPTITVSGANGLEITGSKDGVEPNSDECVAANETLFIPNITTDVGLSPPFNSLFTIFGQFFDHGVDFTSKGKSGTVFVPLNDDDPLITQGPDGVPGTGDEVGPNARFMVLSRATNLPGPDGITGDNPATPAVDESADDIHDATNRDSPFVDQSQTYTSHPSHQVFLREYVLNNANDPVSNGKLISGDTQGGTVDGGQATWTEVKAQASTMLGIKLEDTDVFDIPMIYADPYGNFIPGANGFPQVMLAGGTMVEGDPTANGGAGITIPANALHVSTAFLDDIAHNAVPDKVDTDNNPATPSVQKQPDTDNVLGSTDLDTPPVCATPTTPCYDDELLGAHFMAGDGRVNENIALTAVHQIFHSEHDRLVDDIKNTLTNDTSGITNVADWQLASGADGWNGQRLFQAARFVTEMEYQHLVFEEFARKIQPLINPFQPFAFNQTDVVASVRAEFAHAVYRFGHSMLVQDIPRVDPNGVHDDIPLLDGFLNPDEYKRGGTQTASQAATEILMGLSDQAGNEIDEFVTNTLRNNLLGLPLDLPTINMTRARSEGIPPLNELRRQIYAETADSAMQPYENWIDYGIGLKHPESLVNFVAAYGQHPDILAQPTVAGKRAVAQLIVDPPIGTNPLTIPNDAADFMGAMGTWANQETGINLVDLWIGGLAERTNVFGGHLGNTFNYVFELQLTSLQNGDRLYYLARTPGMNLRTQLEGNSFAELIARNTEAHTLKFDAFATADCKFEIGRLTFPTPTSTTINDDPLSDCDEHAVLIRMPNGTIRYREMNSVDPPGINAQSVFNGTAGTDRVQAGNDSDTVHGNDGNDIIEGGDGGDVTFGGNGDDVMTDIGGDDVIKSGPGNDAVEAGPGLDIIMSGTGKDFTNGGANINETFAGAGDDFVIAGQGEDAVFGDAGDDWQEGGDEPDLLQGDNGNLFFTDSGTVPGNDVLFGQGGDDDYDFEGGDDIGVAGPGIEKVAGAAGYDWEIGQGENAPQDMDLDLALPGLDILIVDVRDKYNEVEALSGWKFDDKLRGDSVAPAAVGGAGFIGCNALDQAGVDRIAGLDSLVDTFPTPTATVLANTSVGICPLTGPNVWGEGNILLGGSGSDILEGRGANDIIDGDRYVGVRLSVHAPGTDTEIGSTDLMEHAAKTGNFGVGSTLGQSLQDAVFKRVVNPGDIYIVRELLTDPDAGAGVDIAQFSGAADEYLVTQNPNGSVTVDHQGGDDGVDTLWNIETLRFCDGVDANGVCNVFDDVPADGVVVGTPALSVTPGTTTAAAPLQFGTVAVGAAPVVQNITVTNSGTGQLNVTSAALTNEAPAGQFSILNNGCAGTPLGAGGSCVIQVGYSPTLLPLLPAARTARLALTTNATNATVFLRGLRQVAALTTATIDSPTDFGTRRIGEPRTQIVKVTNDGAATNLTVTGVSTTGPFTATNVDCTNVLPGRTCRLSVTFNPSAPIGDKTGTVRIQGNVSNAVTPGVLTGTSRAAAVVVDALRIIQVPSPTSVKPVNVSLRVSTASTIRLQVRRTNGKLVWSKSVKAKKAGTNKLKWNLRDSKGRKVKKGKYVFTLTVTDASGAKVVVKKTVRVR